MPGDLRAHTGALLRLRGGNHQGPRPGRPLAQEPFAGNTTAQARGADGDCWFNRARSGVLRRRRAL